MGDHDNRPRQVLFCPSDRSDFIHQPFHVLRVLCIMTGYSPVLDTAKVVDLKPYNLLCFSGYV